MGAYVALFVIGAIGLTLLDSVHVHTHTLVYAHPYAFGSAWWVPLLMGSAASIGGYAYVRGWRALGGAEEVPSWKTVGAVLASFAVMYAASGLLPGTATTKLVVLAVAGVVIHRELGGGRALGILTAAGVVLGPLAEAVNPGFHYADPDFLGVPVWLPALYACATPAMGTLARKLTGSRATQPARSPS